MTPAQLDQIAQKITFEFQILNKKVDDLTTSQFEQTQKLQKIDLETSVIRDAWKAAEGGWRVIEFLGNVAKTLAPIILVAGIIGALFYAYVKDWKTRLLEILK